MRLGCNTVLFSSQDLAGALKHIAWCGFQEVELAAIPGMCEHVAPGRDDVARIKQQLEEAGLRAVAMESAMNLTNPSNIPRFIAALRFAAKLGIEVVNTGNGGKSDDPEAEQAVYDAIRQIAPHAQKLGVMMGVKAHVNQAIYNTASALRALDAVGDIPGWGVNYDASHLYRVGDDMVQAVEQLGTRIVSVHIRDTLERVIPIGPPPTQIPGRGSIDLRGVLAALQGVGYKGPIDLEVIGAGKLEDWQATAIAAESRGYLHRTMQTLVA
jgi:sugar phosphate isomerase/epimerase